MAVDETKSLVTTEEAEDYFALTLHAAAWESASVTDKDKALATASRQINALSFVGWPASTDQANAFPRCYQADVLPDASKRWRQIQGGWCETSIPQQVKEAACDHALFLLSQTAYERDRARHQAAGIVGVGMGKASEQSTQDLVAANRQGPVICPEAMRKLAPWIARVVNLG